MYPEDLIGQKIEYIERNGIIADLILTNGYRIRRTLDKEGKLPVETKLEGEKMNNDKKTRKREN